MDFITQNLEVIIAAAAILAALVIAMMIFGAFSRRTRGRRGQRLGISEYHELDQTRRLVLIRRDETEHLILIGGVQDLVIETGIGPGTHQSYVPSAPADDSPRAMVMRPPPRPPVFGERRPALRPVERDEPQLASSRPLEPEKGG